MTQYPTLELCHDQLFPYIRKRMATEEPAPAYEYEPSGLKKMNSTLTLMQRDEYGDDLEKAAYLFCSIIDGHPFSNGNKRLAVTLLIAFLLVNGYAIHARNMHLLREQMQAAFPKIRWEKVTAFSQPHEHFFYHLALIIADRTQKGAISFQRERVIVRQLLEPIVVAPDEG